MLVKTAKKKCVHYYTFVVYMSVCNNVKNPRKEYLRTKTGYIQQWQTPVEGNSNKEKKRKKEKKVRQPHKLVTSLDKCRVAFYWVTLYLL